MSGKRVKKNSVWPALAIVAACLIAVAGYVHFKPENAPEPEPAPVEPESSGGVVVENVEKAEVTVFQGLEISEIGSYTGVYMEDGSDEVLTKILMLVVTNTGDKTVQYAEIELTDGTQTARFALTTLPPGQSAVLLEQNRMAYDEGKDLPRVDVPHIAIFPEEPGLNEDKLSLQPLNGMLNVTNISGADITGDIAVYYKNASADMLYGGITYRVIISGGLKAGEIRQVPAGHLSESGSRIMFTTVS